MKLTERNKQVFRSSRFFVSVPKEPLPGKNSMLSEEDVLEETICPASKTDFFDTAEHRVGRLKEEQGTIINREFSSEPMILEKENISGGTKVQEVSDEVERLSQRYGRRMEDWVSDES